MKRSGHWLIRGYTGPCHSAGGCEALEWPPYVPLHTAAGLPFLILGTEPSSGRSSSALTDKSDGTEQPSQGPGSGQAAKDRWRSGAGSQPLYPWVPADGSYKARDQCLRRAQCAALEKCEGSWHSNPIASGKPGLTGKGFSFHKYLGP